MPQADWSSHTYLGWDSRYNSRRRNNDRRDTLTSPQSQAWLALSPPMSAALRDQLLNLAEVCGVDYEYEDLDSEDFCVEFLSRCVNHLAKSSKKSTKKKKKGGKKEGDDRCSDDPISKKARELQNDLTMNASTLDNANVMRSKNIHLMNQIKKLQEQRTIMETFIGAQNKKMDVLIDHVEKLMKYIKTETGLRKKAYEAERDMKKVNGFLREKIEKQQQRIATEKRLVLQLAEGSKVLEDQLKLMDEKFLETRAKLDLYRTQFTREISKSKKEAHDIR